MATPTQSTASTIMLGALAGGLVARTVDELAPSLSHTFTAMGRTFTLRATTVAGIGVLAATLAGVKIPLEAYLVPMAAGALAFEGTVEVGDDLAALALGLPRPGAPAPPAQPIPLPASPSPYLYPGYVGGQVVDDYTFGQARQALGHI